jgi:hypothetical protein
MNLMGEFTNQAFEWDAKVEVLTWDIQKPKIPKIIALIFTLIEGGINDKRFAFRVGYLPHAGEYDQIWEENAARIHCKIPQMHPDNWPQRGNLPKGVSWWDETE